MANPRSDGYSTSESDTDDERSTPSEPCTAEELRAHKKRYWQDRKAKMVAGCSSSTAELITKGFFVIKKSRPFPLYSDSAAYRKNKTPF